MYFSIPTEPSLNVAIITLIICSIGLFLCRYYTWLGLFLWMALFTILGFTNGILHTRTVMEPILPEYHKTYRIDGWVEKSRRSKKLQQFYIRVDQIENLSPNKTPKRVRVRLKPGPFKPGDSIRVKAVLKRPPIPSISQGYDPARRAFFEQIGAYGFAVSSPETIELPAKSASEWFHRQLVKFRYRVSRHIQARAPPKTAGLQAALLTGDRSAIPEAQEDSLRDAGLAHLLAISGLHMGLLAGGAYYMAALFLSMIGPWARRYDMRKWAALIGALFATGYLLMSGASVSTQRAYIMAMIIFAALMLDRRAVSMRSVAVAAAITLLLHPENLLNAGFHMSFSATAALVAVYRYWADRRDRYSEDFRRTGWFYRFWRGFTGLSVTSFVAGTATAGFAALHFNRFARYGFAGNLAAMPMFTFIAMPAGFLAVLLIPFGLDIYALQVMGWGLDYVLYVSDWISSREGAIAHIKGANGTIVAIFGLGFTLLCIGPKWIRVLGISLSTISILLWVNVASPDMRVSQDGRVAFWTRDQVGILQVDRARADKFGRMQFMEKSGYPDAQVQSFVDTTASCDTLGCRIELKHALISLVYEPEGVMQACRDSDLVILTARKAGPVARWKCEAVLIDTNDLKDSGALDITINNGNFIVNAANPKSRQKRPWGS